MDPAASYLEALGFALASTTGAVLELGAGEYSTPFLHGYCEAAKRSLITVESDPTWFERVKEMEAPHHGVYSTDGGWRLEHHEVYDGRPVVWHEEVGTGGPRAQKVSVVFVDNEAEGRGPSILRWLPWAQMVVVHDTEPEVAGFYPGMHEAMKGAKWRRDFKRVTPWTSVLSSEVQPSAS